VGTSCSSCNDTTDFRIMNNGTNRCDPLPGYYDTGVTAAAPCSSNCSTCTSASLCTACFTPYSISGSVCVLNCTLALGNCTTCVDNAGQVDCTVCVLGFYLDPVAKNCSIVCGDGIIASTEECDDGDNSTGNGCDSTCSIEPAFYCNGTVGDMSSCGPC
jgi:cysteine-rich repeat protein